MSLDATTVHGCTVSFGFMGDTCKVCGQDNFGGQFCRSVEERNEREKQHKEKELT